MPLAKSNLTGAHQPLLPDRELMPVMSSCTVCRCRVLNFKRPNYSPGVPMDYQRLTEICWAQNAEDRPTAEAVVAKIQVDHSHAVV